MGALHQALGLAVALSISLLACALEEVKFGTVDSKAENQVVLVYRSAEEASESAVSALTDAETKLKEIGVAGMESMKFVKSNAADPSNSNDMLKKGIATYPMIFVSVKGQGLDRYMREISTEKLVSYIRTKLEPTTDDDVFPFNRELISKEYPTMIHFMEEWCTRCKTFKHAFQYAATETVGSVMFMEVTCSSTKDSKKFCDQHKIDGYPTVVLTGGHLKKPLYYNKDRTIPGVMEFLKENVPDLIVASEAEDV